MQTISLKMDQSLLTEIDSVLKQYRYGTRTEFIRDAIRKQLREFEKEIALQKIKQFHGKYKGKFTMTDEEAREIVFQRHAKKFNLSLD